MPGGRPTKLTKALVAKARTYDYTSLRQAVPTIEGLALYLGVHRDTLYAWLDGDGRLNDQISDIVATLLTKQGLELVNNGLRGRFNAKITNMMLSKHGYIERSEQNGEQKLIIETRKYADDDDQSSAPVPAA